MLETLNWGEMDYSVFLGPILFFMGTLIGIRIWKAKKRTPLTRKQGTVKWFNPTKGFGFIEQDQGEDLFVHQTEISHKGFRSLNKSDRVEFEVGEGQKGPIAKNVRRIGGEHSFFNREQSRRRSRAS